MYVHKINPFATALCYYRKMPLAQNINFILYESTSKMKWKESGAIIHDERN